ncbi:MAG: IclR family transcriptional regulator [Clostridia bacterium]|nr:IclR family transcriptional regulator [Clostridia bacterium]
MNNTQKSIATSTPGSIEKALDLLEIFAIPPYEYTIPELVGKTGFNRTTIHRTLKILMNKDFIMFDRSSEKYKIGHAMYHVGTVYLYNDNYKKRLMEILIEISEITKESIGMAVKKGDKIMSLLEVELHQPMKFNDFPGKYFPPNKGCYGKCLMAYQPPEYIEATLEGQTFEKTCYNTLTTKEELMKEYAQIRMQGYVTSIDELGVDILATGIPIFDRHHKIAAVVAIAFYRSDGWNEKLEHFREILRSYQEQISLFMP